MTRVLLQQEVVGRPSSSSHHRGATRSGRVGTAHARNTSGLATGSTRRPIRKYLRLPKTLALILVAAGLVYALVAYVPELGTLAQGEADSETFEEAAMPDFANVLASIPRREVVFDMTDDLEYLVQDGETLSEIAHRFDLSTEFLAKYNGLSNADLLKLGQTIVIPSRQNRE